MNSLPRVLLILFAALAVLAPTHAQEDASASTDAQFDLPDWITQEGRLEYMLLFESYKAEYSDMMELYSKSSAAATDLATTKRAGADEDAIAPMRDALRIIEEEIAATQERVDSIEAEMSALTSLLSWPNPVHWAKSHLAAMLMLIVVWFVGTWLIRLASAGIMRHASRENAKRTPSAETLQRTETLVLVFRKTLRFMLALVLFIMLLGELGVNTTAVVAGLGLLGLAVSFGSQSLVKDFISGFFMLLEGQLAIGDVVGLGGTSGTVENFTLRVTQLRDASGAVHFIPNGSIGEVTNHTHKYSKALITVGASYREDPDQVMVVLRKLLDEFALDAEWHADVLEKPSILGVDALNESEVAFKMSIKVTPGRQWAAKREVLRRVKIAFDLNDIEIPFPQRVNYTAGAQPASKVLNRNSSRTQTADDRQADDDKD